MKATPTTGARFVYKILLTLAAALERDGSNSGGTLLVWRECHVDAGRLEALTVSYVCQDEVCFANYSHILPLIRLADTQEGLPQLVLVEFEDVRIDFPLLLLLNVHGN